MIVNSLHYTIGPLIALAVVAVIIAISVWIWPSRQRHTTDFGLLTAVATVTTEQEAGRLRALLAAEGVRATVTRLPAPPVRISPSGVVLPAPPSVQVLVFPTDADRARQALQAG